MRSRLGFWVDSPKHIQVHESPKGNFFCIISFFSFFSCYSYLMALHFLSAVGVGYSFFQACKMFSKGTHLYYISYHQYIFWVCVCVKKSIWRLKAANVLPGNDFFSFIFFFNNSHPLFSFSIELTLENGYIKRLMYY